MRFLDTVFIFASFFFLSWVRDLFRFIELPILTLSLGYVSFAVVLSMIPVVWKQVFGAFIKFGSRFTKRKRKGSDDRHRDNEGETAEKVGTETIVVFSKQTLTEKSQKATEKIQELSNEQCKISDQIQILKNMCTATVRVDVT